MDYRREIDGLRALAVIPVILFHAGFELFSGGFVGVDIFFVISGYLITTIIVTELENNTFSIVKFYERRARRILPVLFFVMLACIPFAWLLLPATDMKDFSQSLIAVSIFSSNFLFWNESGYFDTAAEMKPLLHTWSLAVEEQFYIIFPIFLMVFWRLGKRWILILLTFIFFLSLAAAQWSAHAAPASAFYLLHTRAWELVIGALASFYLSRTNRKKLGHGSSDFAGWLGVALILYAVFNYSKATPFPGFFALVPTVGTLLIILFANQHNSVGKFIGNRLFVGIGLISYSAYLWHQPLFAFARYTSISQSTALYIILSVTALLLGYFSWRFIENPFRNKTTFSRRNIFTFSALGIISSLTLGYTVHTNNGFPKEIIYNKPESKKVTDKNFIVVGDSHGDHLVFGLKSITSGDVSNQASGGCVPFRNVDRYDYRFVPGECAKRINKSLDKIMADDPNAIIILSSMGPVYLEATAFKGKDTARVTGSTMQLINDTSVTDQWKVFEIGLRSTLSELTSLSNSQVVFAFDVPELGIDFGCDKRGKELYLGPFILNDMVSSDVPKDCFVTRTEYEDRVRAYKALVTRVLSDYPGALLYDPTTSFCDSKKCKGFDPAYKYLYRDIDHLSNSGSQFYADNFFKFLSNQKAAVIEP